VLDVGVTSDRREDCNFFEKLYPHKDKITAVGMEDAAFLEEEYPGLKYVRSDGLSLPFPDKSFDLVVSFAVIEHVGSRTQQQAFVRELCRVGKTCCITTPNRWYPIEFHTAVPLIHWFPPSWFRALLKLLGKHFFAKEENLNLLSEKEVLKMLPADAEVYTRHFRLLGLISNLLFYVVI
jgi:ubiquinone/menaquinone biosynthesis C-methylase UbiE